MEEDIISEIEELLGTREFSEHSEVLDSEDIFLKNDSDVIETEFENDTELIETNLESHSEVLDINVENNTDILEENLENDSEMLNLGFEEEALADTEKDSEEAVSPPKKSKKEETTRYRPLNLPLARIKQIIKMDPDVNLAGSEAVFLIAKATEMFIELLSKDSYAITALSKKKTIQKKDVDAAIQNTDALVFLDGAMDF